MNATALPAGPSLCALCRRWGGPVCGDCDARFAPPRARCRACGLPTGTALDRCGACQREALPLAATVCALDYAFPWDGLIAAWKFRSETAWSRPFAQRLLAAVQDAGATADLVLPMPLASRRLAERGYNQAWELARRVAAALGCPAQADLLQRLDLASDQHTLTRAERLRNLRGVFHLPAHLGGVLRGRRLAVVDDVMTTGASLSAVASVLLEAGATEVQAWVLARTPKP